MALTLLVLNRSPQPVSLTFRNAQRYDIVVQDAKGDPVWRWSAGRMFAQVMGEETLQPTRGEVAYRITVREPFPQGRYTVIGMIPAEEGPMSANIKITVQ